MVWLQSRPHSRACWISWVDCCVHQFPISYLRHYHLRRQVRFSPWSQPSSFQARFSFASRYRLCLGFCFEIRHLIVTGSWVRSRRYSHLCLQTWLTCSYLFWSHLVGSHQCYSILSVMIQRDVLRPRVTLFVCFLFSICEASSNCHPSSGHHLFHPSMQESLIVCEEM